MVTRTFRTLPSKLFLVRVPAIATFTDFDIQERGIPISYLQNDIKDDKYGDLQHVRVNYDMGFTELSTVMLPLIKIIDIYRNGYPIYVVNKQDATEMFNILDEYIMSFKQKPTSLNAVREKPLDLLYDIDKFVTEILGFHNKAITADIEKENSYNPYGVAIDLMPLPRVQPTVYKEIEEDPDIVISRPILNYINNNEASDAYNNYRPNNNIRNVSATVGDNVEYSYVPQQLPTANGRLTRKPIFKSRF